MSLNLLKNRVDTYSSSQLKNDLWGAGGVPLVCCSTVFAANMPRPGEASNRRYRKREESGDRLPGLRRSYSSCYKGNLPNPTNLWHLRGPGSCGRSVAVLGKSCDPDMGTESILPTECGSGGIADPYQRQTNPCRSGAPDLINVINLPYQWLKKIWRHQWKTTENFVPY